MDIYIYIDESGVLHKNAPDDKFVYTGLIFFNKKEKDKAATRFKKIESEISSNYDGELKANRIKNKHKKTLFNCVKNEKRFIIDVSINQMYDSSLGDKRTIQRFKDYSLARTIKESLRFYNIPPSQQVNLHLLVDEQNICTNGRYNLKESIIEELFSGKYNDYHKFIKPYFNVRGIVKVQYCDSNNVPLIRGADILANRKFWKLRKNQKITGGYISKLP